MTPVTHAPVHLVLAVHGIEGQVLQREFLTDLEAPQVQQQVRPLSRRQIDLPYQVWPIQEAAIRGYYPVGEELAATDSSEGEPVEASVGGVEQSEAVEPRLHLEAGGRGHVDQNDVPGVAHGPGHLIRVVDEVPFAAEVLVLDDEGKVGLPEFHTKRLVHAALVLVLDDKEPGESHIDLTGGIAVAVGVVPVRPSSVRDGVRV